jgi:mono/diheme cytochrome c family protein
VNRFVIAGATLFLAAAAPPASVWDGIYTEVQASLGESGYRKNCASCHGEKLEGSGQTPALAGNEFVSTWDGMSVGDLFDQMKSTMPADRPGQLSPAENADILAYLLKFNSFPHGQSELAADSEQLKRIRFEANRPRK